MTDNDLAPLAAKENLSLDDFKEKFVRTLHEISKGNSNGEASYLLEEKRSGKKSAVWIEELMALWTGLEERKRNHLSMPHRVDGYFVKGDNAYLIECKGDKDWSGHKDDFWVKFHDSYVQLLNQKWLTFEEAQQHLTYIIINKTPSFELREEDIRGFADMSIRDKNKWLMAIHTGPMSDGVQRPWLYPEIRPRCDLDVMTGFSCKRTLTLTVPQFDRFVSEEQWQ